MTTLLAVDDSSTMRKVIDITFAGEGFEPVLAGNAQEALDCLQETRAPIALVDITLGMDSSGYDLCQQIKAAAPGTKVLLLSSKQNPYDAARGSSVGADDHLDKPFDTQTLIDKVTNLAEAATSEPAPAATTYSDPPTAPPPAPAPKQDAAPAALSEPAEEEVSSVVPVPAYQPPAQSDRQQASSPPAVPAANAANMETRLADLGLTREQVQGVLALSRDAVEQAVWEVVPVLAETLIREEIERLTRE